jgi:hypothetical protein
MMSDPSPADFVPRAMSAPGNAALLAPSLKAFGEMFERREL